MKSASYDDTSCHACERMGRPWAKPSWPSTTAFWDLVVAIHRHGIGTYWTLRRSKCSGCASVARVIRQVGLCRYLSKLGLKTLDRSRPAEDRVDEWLLSTTLRYRKTISGKYDVDAAKALLSFLLALGINKGLDDGSFMNAGWLVWIGRRDGKDRFLDEY